MGDLEFFKTKHTKKNGYILVEASRYNGLLTLKESYNLINNGKLYLESGNI